MGKLTIARALASMTGGRLFHNHLTVNLALSVFDFGTPGFVALRERVWMETFRAAVAERVPLLIFTFNPENTVPQSFIDGLFSEMTAAGVEMIPVELTASEEAIEERIVSESRRIERKTLGLAAYRELREEGVFVTPVIPTPRLTIDTEKLSPSEAAEKIATLT